MGELKKWVFVCTICIKKRGEGRENKKRHAKEAPYEAVSSAGT